MTNTQPITTLVEQYGPQMPLPQLIAILNELYHSFEAQDYDGRHPEIYEQLPSLWQEMINQVVQQFPSREWRILNVGCGTGFEAEQVLGNLPQGSVVGLTCYDPSIEMLEHCRSRIALLFPETSFCSAPSHLPTDAGPYNLLVTNSLLHHLPDPVATIRDQLPLLSPDALWLAGHEPSNRFYKNPACLKAYEAFLRERRWRRFFSPGAYLRRIKQAVGLESNPASSAAREAFRQGLFAKLPPASLVARLVDFHVVHSPEEVALGWGFDFERMQQDFTGSWTLIWVRSYSFMGTFYDGNLPAKWSQVSRELAGRFPQDGANFCAVWRRS